MAVGENAVKRKRDYAIDIRFEGRGGPCREDFVAGDVLDIVDKRYADVAGGTVGAAQVDGYEFRNDYLA